MQFIIKSNVVDGKISQQKGWIASTSKTGQSRTLLANETVYVTRLNVDKESIHFELLTTNVTTLAFGNSTRYRSELVFHIPGLDTMSEENIYKAIDEVMADAATANAVQTKSIALGMSPDAVKSSLGNPQKTVDLGEKVIFIYPDMKVVFKDSKVVDVQ